jgi:hypothetical protein
MTLRSAFLLVALAGLAVACGGGSTGSTAARQPGSQASSGVSQGAASSGSAAGSTQQPGPPSPPLPEGTRVQRSAQLDLLVGSGEFDRSIDRVLGLVDAEGGFVAGNGSIQPAADRSGRSGRLSFQVPTAKFDATLVALRKFGQTRRFDVSGTDVSTQYVDLQARLANAEQQRNAFLALLQRAQSIQDIIALQNQLGQVTGQIEQVKGQIDYLDHTTTYGTVVVDISEGPAAGSPVGGPGLAAAFAQGSRNFLAVVDFLVVALATLAPFLALAGIGAGCWWAWRRRPAPAPTRS